MTEQNTALAIEHMSSRIFWVRGHRVVLDQDLAEIYGVAVKRLNEQVRRNAERFPQDFAFVVDEEEWASLRSQIATLNTGRGSHRKYRPWVFTEHGAVMAASVLNTRLAIEMSVHVVRTFVRQRALALEHQDLWRKLMALEKKVDRQFKVIFDAIDALLGPQGRARRRIGF